MESWIKSWRTESRAISFLLILAGSRTAEVEGISAAGATAESRRYTALADAELLLKGPTSARKWQLPQLSAGVSPALISFVALRSVGLDPMVLAVGLQESPNFPHLRCEQPFLGPAQCLSTGKALAFSRVHSLWQRGLSMGRRLRRPLLLAECVPGGTTTAQAVLTGLGISVAELISGSGRRPPMNLKKELVERGLVAASLGQKRTPKQLIAAVGDPFQPVAVGILLGVREAGFPVLLGGGSQMLAVLALALAELKPNLRKEFLSGVSIGTTAWLLDEASIKGSSESSLVALIGRIEDHFGVSLLGFSSGLRFHLSGYQLLRDFELGYVKEGVGAGALSLLAELYGASSKELVEACDQAMEDLLKKTGDETSHEI